MEAGLFFTQTAGLIEGSVIKIVLYAIVGENFLISYWINDRKAVLAKRKRELEKMKTSDLI